MGWVYGTLVVVILVGIVAGISVFNLTHDKDLFSFIKDNLYERRWSGFDATKISEPLQMPYIQKEPIVQMFGEEKFVITPVAMYKASVLIGGKEYYNDEFKACPVDLVFVWGDIAKPEYMESHVVEQSDRAYRFKSDSQPMMEYVQSHSSNNHIIPANDKVMEGLNAIRNYQTAYLEGYLVNVEYTHDGERKNWGTSLSREDIWGKSCETFYVKKIELDGEVYG